MEHRLPELAIREEVARATWRMATLAAVAFVCTVVIVPARSDASPMFVAVLVVPILAYVVISGRRTTRRRLQSFVLNLSESSIAVHGGGVIADAEITRDETERIEERDGQGLTIRAGPRWAIGVPARIEGYASVRETLSMWRPIEPIPATRTRFPVIAVMFAMAGAWLACYVSNDARIVVPLGSTLVIALGVSIVMVVRNPSVDRKLKRTMFIGLLPALAILARVIEVARR